ncbi:hypothetical protein AB0L65_39800 [Nonomuraea sp. NPDC052116]|uniref:hypothetical protein n=1 Tax=Nonomuraea sp. NPDC052116 TaxID=3155665 RepID=UPI003448BBC2
MDVERLGLGPVMALVMALFMALFMALVVVRVHGRLRFSAGHPVQPGGAMNA